ncbi:hypothetical protein FSB78_13525 [Sphingomonas ginsenosidivorax]|uniref:CopG family transcriptional regulator n=1 Tax=Sphingomonas ginsenosidivorax TaxID=862135 RepID=A0A5C6UIR1_9SPHN|nr:hypothetical protein [Sphingomonas ginsenosidivorax]TXC71858.1 hypothetical protein FSB78_13525 [Sphingomonas ginsenosidivorax]
MQTERVTFLTTPDHKAALDAFAVGSGRSVGHVVREATSQYIAGGEGDEQEALALLSHEISLAVPRMQADMREAIASIERANKVVDDILAGGTRHP